MSMNRREFLQHAAVYSALGLAPQFLSRTAAAQAEAAAIHGFTDDRVLVVVQLGGGNDGLNTVTPWSDDAYYRARPNLALPKKDLLRLNDDLALHPGLKPLMRLYDDGLLGIVQGVGYPNPDRSHFRSMEIWHTASDADEYLGHGWLGRYFDNACSGTARPQAGMAIGAERPQAFEGQRGFGIATEQPERFGWNPGMGNPAQLESSFEALNAGADAAHDTLDFLRHTTANAIHSSKEVQAAASKGKVAGPERRYRRGAFNQLDVVAGLIRGGLDTRIYYVSTSGFDTHANQAGQHDRLLSNVGEALAGFQAQLKRDGTAHRVITMVFSEFGRRVQENGSGGTDHGTAAPLFVMGEAIQPGIHGIAPSLEDLDGGDLKYTTDFRQVYGALLEDWFRTDSAEVLHGSFESLPIIRG